VHTWHDCDTFFSAADPDPAAAAAPALPPGVAVEVVAAGGLEGAAGDAGAGAWARG